MNQPLFANLNFLLAVSSRELATPLISILKKLGAQRLILTATTTSAISEMILARHPLDCTIAELDGATVHGLQLLKSLRTGLTKPSRPDSCFLLVTEVVKPDSIKLAKELDVNGVLLAPLSAPSVGEGIARARARSFQIQPEKYLAAHVPDWA